MQLLNWRIGARLGLAFGLLLALLLALALVAQSRMARIQDNLDLIVNDNNVKIATIHQMLDHVHGVGAGVRDLILITEDAPMAAALSSIGALRKDYAAQLALLSERVRRPEGRAQLAAILAAQAAAAPLLARTAALGRANHTEDATRLMLEQARPALLRWLDTLHGMAEYQQRRAVAAQAEARAAYEQAQRLTWSLALGALLLGALAGWWITRGVTRPLGLAVRLAEAVAQGDLGSRVDSAARDETGQLLRALGRMNGSLAAIVVEVRDGTEAIGVAAAEIASGNADLSRRTEQQAGALEETASSMEQLTAAVRHNAASAQQAGQLAAGAADVARQGSAAVAQVVATMQAIEGASRQIADIIGVIDGIAFQTNILALNAAVEAARAGEQGRGFAVVATEVRALAQRSAVAAREIKALIEVSVATVDAGGRQVEQAGATMTQIVAGIAGVHAITTEIAAASDEQSAGIGQINEAITAMDQVTQQNAALVEQVAAAAEAMRQQADGLARAVAVFRTEARAPAVRRVAAASALPRLATQGH